MSFCRASLSLDKMLRVIRAVPRLEKFVQQIAAIISAGTNGDGGAAAGASFASLPPGSKQRQLEQVGAKSESCSGSVAIANEMSSACCCRRIHAFAG